jgi:murein DD-endopeptidase MepM/ murein hydrolase activator NlpD
MTLRIVGVDTPNSGISLPFQQQEVSIPDVTGKYLASGDAAVTQSFEFARDTVTTVARQSQPPQQSNTLAAVMDTAGRLLDRWNSIKAAEAKALEAQQQKLQKEAESDAAIQLEDVMFGLRNRLQKEGYERGLVNVREQVRQLILSNPNLSPEAKKELARRAYSHLDEMENLFFKNAYEENRDIKRTEVGQAEALVRFQSAQDVAALVQSADRENPEAIDMVFQKIEARTNETARKLNLDPWQTSTLRASILKQVADVAGDVYRVRAAAQDRLARTIEAQKKYAQIEALEQSGQVSFEEAQYLRQQVDAEFGQTAARPVTTLDALEQQNRYANLQFALEELQEKQFLKKYDAATLLEAQVTADALKLLDNPSMVWQYKQLKTIDNQRVLSMYEYLKDTIPKVQGTQKQLVSLQREIEKKTALLERAESVQRNPALIEKFKNAGLMVPDPSQIPAIQAEIRGLQAEYQTVAGATNNTLQSLSRLGVVFDANGRYQLNPELMRDLEIQKQRIAEGGFVGKRNPFNRGEGSPGQKQPAAPLARMNINGNDIPVPFIAQHVGKVQFTSGFGPRSHPIRGGVRHHNGIDLAAPTGTPTTALRSGVVTKVANDPNGYGNYVEVKMNDGKYALYGHLDSVSVKVGQTVVQGQVVGKVGSTGGSTGPHLHLSIFNSDTDNHGIDPVAYLRSITAESPPPIARGLGLPPRQGAPGGRTTFESGATVRPLPPGAPPYGALLLPSGGYVWGGTVYRPAAQGGGYREVGKVEKHINKARPMTGTRMSGLRSDYPQRNDPEADYGYKVLAEDAQFRRALAGVADRLNIPAQWLADIMAFETGGSFSPSITNGIGATGLIQFTPATASLIGTTTSELRKMTRTQQLRYVEKYLKAGIQEQGVGPYKRIDDLFAYVWGGGGLVRTPDSKRANQSDGDIKYIDYLNRLGEHAQRSYAHALARGSERTHTRPYSNCATCRQQLQQFGKIIAHTGK